ncbi:ADP-ribosylation factor GTPase-activating protein [Thraustotheca clavata]|uniref:ADP-ribosylation factor GTPase-activating protein n=1 Tax=Thraustotheca clavata TaxID=74557 RepID=A0A1W0A248_9STRA|nr:ADP-ribosylation factor GTPase-activating protein [Thraustotheca clavata]
MTKYVPHEVRDKFFQAQRAIAANKICFDCDRRSPMWATVSFGIFMCLDCSGYHRRLGVHVSFVRSTDMDEWTEEQLLTIQLGGNNEARKFFKQHGVTDMMNIDEKYKTKAAALYKAQLAKKVQTAKFDATPYTTIENTSAVGTGGLDDLVMMVGAGDSTPVYTQPAAPVRLAASAPAKAPEQHSGLLDTNRPVVLLGGNAPSSAPVTTGAISSKLASRRTSASTASKARASTRLGATKVKTSFDDFDSIPFENPKPSPAEVAASKQIDDDEALARAIQEAEEESLSTSLKNTHVSIPPQSLQSNSSAAPSLDKYKNSKSISSANYFAGENVDADREKIRQFSGAQAISSDMYYGNGERPRSSSVEAADEAAYQLEQLKAQVSEKATKLKSMTSNFFSDLQNRYG